MCGRAAQSVDTVQTAVNQLLNNNNNDNNDNDNNDTYKETKVINNCFITSNLHPGCPFYVLTYDPTSSNVKCTLKVWGLITKSGSSHNPLSKGVGKHFAAKMFNARSESAHEKISFQNLIRPGNSCVIPLDGFYEWKSPENAMLDGKKQPYFVYNHRSSEKCCNDGWKNELLEVKNENENENDSKSNPFNCHDERKMEPMFVAGLCTRVQTGDSCSDTTGADILETFTILTTNASPILKWLHHRQPLLLRGEAEVVRWLREPSAWFLQKYNNEISASHNNSLDKDRFGLEWHPVTKKINNVQYRGDDCMIKVTLGTRTNIQQMLQSQKLSKMIKFPEALKPDNDKSFSYMNKPIKRNRDVSIRSNPVHVTNKPKANLFTMGFQSGVTHSNSGTARSPKKKKIIFPKPTDESQRSSLTQFFKIVKR